MYQEPSSSDRNLLGERLDQGFIDSSAEWEPPMSLGHFDVPTFPLEAIPRQLCALCVFCAAVAKSYQVPPDLPALLALAVGGAALAKRIEVHVQGDWREPVNLFVAVGMESGERKSAVYRCVSAPLVEFEHEELERLGPEIEQNLTERQILAMSLQDAQRRASKGSDVKIRERALQEAKELSVTLKDKVVLRAPRYLADDATPESVARLLFENDGRLALLSPEGDTFDLMAGRYNDRGPNLGVYLKGHTGDDIRVDRISKDRPPEFVCRPALTVGLAVQPAVFRGLMQKKGFRGRGLLARFIYALPASLVGYRELKPDSVPTSVAEAYGRLIRAALRLEPTRDELGRPQPITIPVGAEALAELDKFRRTIEAELRRGGLLSDMRDWGNKLPGAVCRIAGIFHGLMHASSPDDLRRPIDSETMLCALAIGEYAIAHAKAAFYEMGASEAIGLARRMLLWVAEDKLSEFTRRDAFNELRGTVHQVSALDEPLRLLMEHGYIRERPVEHSGPGRKPSPLYDVNPMFLAQNTHNTHNGPAS
ncbi:MAG: DUF3987 domain-containing protein [Planctomycetes bacterium]|nr:DUF3987 domain-containing protein [Planctomycetota bacterium]